jgi:hypothetical protein
MKFFPEANIAKVSGDRCSCFQVSITTHGGGRKQKVNKVGRKWQGDGHAQGICLREESLLHGVK